MSRHCAVPPGNFGSQFVHEPIEGGGGGGEEQNNYLRSSHIPSCTTSNLVPMSNYEFTELRWENGQLAMRGLGELLTATTTTGKPSRVYCSNSSETLESIVHQATLCKKLQNQDHEQSLSANGLAPSGKDGLAQVAGAKKRARLDSGWRCGAQEDGGFEHVKVHSKCASASATFDGDNDTAMMACASDGSLWSLKTSRTADEDSGEEEEDRERDRKRERSRSRRSRAAAVHNESERRRRDRINQRMRILRTLVPNASKSDKVSILDDVIDYMKQLQAQIQLMSFRTSMSTHFVPAPPGPPLGMHHHQFQMSLLAAAAANVGVGGFVPPAPFVVPPMVAAAAQAKGSNRNTSVPLPDPYSAFLAQQTASMDLYNKMAAAFYRQHSNQTTQATSSKPSQTDHDEGD